jgi:hypothetical protein
MVRVARKNSQKAIGKMMALFSVNEVLTDRFETTSQSLQSLLETKGWFYWPYPCRLEPNFKPILKFPLFTGIRFQ